MKLHCICLCTASLVFTSCRATVLTPSAADALRYQVQQLEAKNSALDAQVEELQAQLASKSSADVKAPSAELEQATPRIAKIFIENLSRVIAQKQVAGSQTQPEQLLLFVNSEDGKGRPIQLTGELTLEASLQMPGGKVMPLAAAHWGPLQLRDHYRIGIGTPHYSLEAPTLSSADWPQDVARATALVVVTYIDGWTGRVLKSERAIAWPIDDFTAKNAQK